MKFDDVIAELNGFGRFQFKLVLMLVLPRMTLLFHFLLNNFIAYIPSHHCNISVSDNGSVFRNLSSELRLAVSIPVQEDGTLSSCQMFAEPQYHLLFNSSNVTELPTVFCQNGFVYDTSVVKSTLASEWDLVCERRRMNQATASIFFMGAMLGAGVLGTLSDWFGRRTMLLVSCLTTACFGFASALSYNLSMFAVMRFFTGFGCSGIAVITNVLCIEWTDIKHRCTLSILISLDWSVNTMLLAVLAYLVRDWRYLTAAVTTPAFLGIICAWIIPESARWLLGQGNASRAHFYLSECAKVNHREQFMDHLNPENLSKVIIADNENKKYSVLDLVRTPRMRRLAVLTGTVWFGLTCSYYGISFNVSGFGVNIYLTQFIHGASEIPAKIFILFTLDTIGRQINQAVGLLLTGLCLLGNMLIPHDMGSYRAALGAMGKMFAQGSFTVLFLYTAELYPTVVRLNGMGYCSFLARLGVAVCPLINFLDEVWVGLPSLIFSLMALAAGTLTMLLPETKNARLPQTIQDVEETI
uniref:solute carrier family 22 member 7-like n=1 Tax=Doryrhamphus excisus TaxID=161450 RepID=UPI0025AEC03E|nr:solute carrier family 22 member 7-like [Doryrhamphus excisus]